MPAVVPESPTGAGVLSTIGGVFIMLGGIAEMLVGAAVSTTLTLGRYGPGIVGLGAFGWGLGIPVLVFWVVSLVCFLGGLVLGFLLGLIGGILAVTWRPSRGEAPVVYASPPAREGDVPSSGRAALTDPGPLQGWGWPRSRTLRGLNPRGRPQCRPHDGSPIEAR